MPKVTNTGWSTANPDPQYLHEVHNVYNQLRQQRHEWGSNVNWNLPTATPDPLIYQGAAKFQQGGDVINNAWNYANEQYNKASAQYDNLSQYGPATVQLGQGVYDKMLPEMEKLFSRYDLSSVDDMLAKLGSPDFSSLTYTAPTIGAVGHASGATATGATVSAVGPERQSIRDVSGINSIDELGDYLRRVDTSAFDAMQRVAEQDLERRRQIQMQQIASQAAAQNAFGGGRHGVVEAETNRAALDAQARLSAEMQARKLEFANAILQTDIGRRMNAQQLNQAADMAVELERARLGTQANIATGQNITQANIATAQNQTQANIANADAQTRAAIAQAQVQAELEKAVLAGKASLMGNELLARANLIGQNEVNKTNMIKTQGDLLKDLAETQYKAEVDAATKNAEFYDNWLDFQKGLGDAYGTLGNSITSAGVLTGEALGKTGQAAVDVGKYLTGLQNQNDWLKWYGDFMGNMWEPTLTQMDYYDLLAQPYGTVTEGSNVTNRPVGWLDILGLGAQFGGAALAATAAGAGAAASDPRLKSGIKKREGSLDRISKLNPIEYSVRGDKKKERLAGLLATEVGKASPSYEAKIGAYNAVNLEPIIADIVGAVQELADKKRKKR